MHVKREWFWFVLLVGAGSLVLFNLQYLGLAVSNTTSNVTISLPNTAPSIDFINDTLFVCENAVLYYEFNITDNDGDVLTGTINPTDPFYLFWIKHTAPKTTTFAIVSSTIDKVDDVGLNSGHLNYTEHIIIDDNYLPTCCYDEADVNITVIEINNLPIIENIGVKTIWTQGDDRQLYEVVDVEDEEYDLGYGDLNFNVTIWNSSGVVVDLFNISDAGVIDFTADNDTELDTYVVKVCVNDTGLTSPYTLISNICSQTGGSLSACDNFTLTVTDENRPPEFTAYFPTNFSFSAPGTSSLAFNITKYDPDGTIPDGFWYVDGVNVEYDSGSESDFFSKVFGCAVSGLHNITAEITDGLLNASLNWTIDVEYVGCTPSSPPSSSSSSSGGPAGPSGYEEFVVDPLFITTNVYRGQGKSYDLTIENTGTLNLNLSLAAYNLSDMALLSEDYVYLHPGEKRVVQVYLYALSSAQPGVYFGKIFIKSGSLVEIVNVVVEVKKREALFDINLAVLPEFKTVTAGDNLKVLVNMLNVGLYGQAVDVDLLLYVTNFDKVILYESSKEVLAVETNLSVTRDLYVPVDTKGGTYLVLGEMKYGNITISTYDTFVVVEKKYVRVTYFIIIACIAILIFFIIFFLWKRRKKKKEEERYRR